MLSIEVKAEQEVLLARIKGEMDLASADKIRAEVDECLKEGELRHLVLDLSGVTFIDSSGIGVILGRYRKLAEGGGKLAILKPQPQVRRVLDIAGLSRLTPYYRNEKEALNELQGKG